MLNVHEFFLFIVRRCDISYNDWQIPEVAWVGVSISQDRRGSNLGEGRQAENRESVSYASAIAPQWASANGELETAWYRHKSVSLSWLWAAIDNLLGTAPVIRWLNWPKRQFDIRFFLWYGSRSVMSFIFKWEMASRFCWRSFSEGSEVKSDW